MQSELVTLPGMPQLHFRRHTANGGGLVADGTHITDDVYVGKDSIVIGGTYTGSVRIEGRSVVVNSELTDHGQTILIANSYVCGSTLGHARIIVRHSQMVDVRYVTHHDINVHNGVSVEHSRVTKAHLVGEVTIDYSVVEHCLVTNTRIAGHSVTATHRRSESSGGAVDGSTITAEECSVNGNNVTIKLLTEPPFNE